MEQVRLNSTRVNTRVFVFAHPPSPNNKDLKSTSAKPGVALAGQTVEVRTSPPSAPHETPNAEVTLARSKESVKRSEDANV